MSAKNTVAVGIVLAFLAPAALAAPTMLASYVDEVIRYDNGTLDAYPVSTRVFGMCYDAAAGEVYAYGDGVMSVVMNPHAGNIYLAPFSTTSQHYGSISRIGGVFYGLNGGGLWTLDFSDPNSPVETLIGSHGVADVGGMAYDAASDTLYMASYETDALYTLDKNTGAATLVGSFGIDMISVGMEWIDGNLYVAAQNQTSGDYEVGVLDTTTGQYTMDFSLQRSAGWVATALTAVPEPGSLSLILVAALVAARRR